MGLGQKHASRSTLNVQRVVQNPSDVMQQVINENQQHQMTIQNQQQQLLQQGEELKEIRNEMRELVKFRQILQNPIDKFTIEMYDDEILRKIRGHMITMFGKGGQMDSEGAWAQTIVNKRFQMVVRQLLFNGLQHWHRVKPQIEEIMRTEGLIS